MHTNNFNRSNFLHSKKKKKKKELAQKYYELLALILNKSPIISVPSNFTNARQNDKRREHDEPPIEPDELHNRFRGAWIGSWKLMEPRQRNDDGWRLEVGVSRQEIDG